MENELTQEEMERVQAMYIGCEAKYTYLLSEESAIVRVSRYEDVVRYGYRTDWWKLLLTPLDKLTDEHIQLLTDMKEYYYLIGIAFKNNLHVGVIPHDVYQQLILWGYAVPLYFGIGHWANGKTAIELRIAQEKEVQP